MISMQSHQFSLLTDNDSAKPFAELHLRDLGTRKQNQRNELFKHL